MVDGTDGAPEAHLAQILTYLDFGSKKVTHPHYIGGALQLLCYKVSSKTYIWGSRTPPVPPQTLGVRAYGVQPSQVAIRNI